MTHIRITVQDQVLTATPDKLLVSHSVGEATFEADFDESWDGYAKTIIFATPHPQKAILYAGGVAEVPWEVLDRPGYLWISAVGHAPGKRRPTAIMRQPLTIAANGRIEGSPPQEHTPALWEQVLEQLQATTLTPDEALEALVEAGMLTPVADGNGAIYTDEDGNICCI